MSSTAETKELRKYIKRTEDFRKWFAKIPDDQVALNEVLALSDKAFARFKKWLVAEKIDVRPHLGYSDEIPLKTAFEELEADEGALQSLTKNGQQWVVPIDCGSVGCVMGWAQYSYFPEKKIKEDVETYFGTSEYQTDNSDLFSERRDQDIEEKQEALRRLDLRIVELKALAGLL